MKHLSDVYTLHNGVTIPCIGYGTFRVPESDQGIKAVEEAIKAGYRHIDTAAGYQNETSVGIAVKNSGTPRSELFITSKLHNHDHGYDATMAAFEKTMANLDMDYLDLYLIHWPNPESIRACWEEKNAESWKAMETLYEAGRIRAIGVSNFMIHHLEALFKTAKIMPMVNQIFLSPGNTQDALVDYCRKHNILLEAYSPLGGGKAFEVDMLKHLADRNNKHIAQVCVRFSLQMGYLPLVKSSTMERMVMNTDVFDFKLSDADMQALIDLKGLCGTQKDPDQISF